MLQHSDALAPLNLHLVSSLEDVYMQSPSALSDGQAARAHAARKSAFLSMSPACNFEAFSLHFHLPLKVAAEKFGVRATAFKKRCRAIGIRHWPYRKVRSLKRSLQELHRCQEQAPLSDKQQAQYATFKRQLDKLMAPETYGLDPSGRLGPQHQLLSDEDEDEESEDNESLASPSPRFASDLSFYDCTVSPTDGDAKTLGDVIPAGSTHLRIRRSQVMHLPPAHLSFFDRNIKDEGINDAYYQHQFLGQFDGLNPSSADKADLVLKASPTSYKRTYVQAEDYPSSGFDSTDLDFLPSETNVRSLNDADEEFTAHASQVDYSSERFFDDVFLQISPDYGCLV
ncbi:putative extracellular protein [Phytophthora megakarya]|uniref:Putative extracellular protein n=1 Tax=Phytophthora megakarya TaxID=4795 RepID=A0A225W7I9_9STRA|nr:putative extracellular protein [Phytophthora megakarya]